MRALGNNLPRNQLLRSLSPWDFAILAAHLEPVDLPLGFPLAVADQTVEKVYFPTHGVASLVATTRTGARAEVGMLGRDGMTGTALLLGAGRTPVETVMQIAGAGLRMTADALRTAMGESVSLQASLSRYAHVAFVQSAFYALANASVSMEARVARWLLMAHDRVDGNELVMTHERLAAMLAVRRSGVTQAIHALEGQRVVRGVRGAIFVLDRPGLMSAAAGSYGRPEMEFERLIAPLAERLA